MFAKDDLNIAGRLTLRRYTRDDRLVEEVTAYNDITLGGRSLVARLFDVSEAASTVKRVSKIHLGSSQVAFDARQTALATKVGEVPIKSTEMSEVTDAAGRPRAMLRIVGELGENDCNDQLREAGLFTDDGVMYNRVTFDTITKSDQFKLTLVWEILF